MVLGNQPQILSQANARQKFFFYALLFWPVVAFLFYKKLRLASILDVMKKLLWNQKNFRTGKWFLMLGVLLHLLLNVAGLFISHQVPPLLWILVLILGQVGFFSFLSARLILDSEREGIQMGVLRMLTQVVLVCGKGAMILIGIQVILLYLGLWPQLTALSLPEVLKSLQQLGWIHHILRGVLFVYGGIFAGVNLLYGLFSWILIQILLPGLAFWKAVEGDSKAQTPKN